MLVGAVIWPDPATKRSVDRFRRRYDPHFRLIAPHITVIFPVEVSLPIAEIIPRVRESIHGLHAFDIRLAKLSSVNHLAVGFPEGTAALLQYPNAKNTIFLLATEGSSHVIELKERIGPPVGMPQALGTYPPYLTLGQTLSDSQYSEALEYLSSLHFDHRFRVRSFDLLTAAPEGRWTLIERIALSGD